VYPDRVFDDLVALTQLPDGGRILEIGCGTGQATLPLAERGFAVCCIELGEQLAELARRKLAGFPKVEVVHASFETWEPDDGDFDAAVAFTAFHWIDPNVRYEKTARLLRDEAALVVVETQHVLRDDGDRFWTDVQEDYDAITPSNANRPPPRPDEVGDLREEIEASGLFGPVSIRRHLWDVTYTADEYRAVLGTYSPNRALDEHSRRRLFELIHRRVEAQPTRTVKKTYLATLNVARRF
jgi:SAM-dependent methyltransferase